MPLSEENLVDIKVIISGFNIPQFAKDKIAESISDRAHLPKAELLLFLEGCLFAAGLYEEIASMPSAEAVKNALH